MLSTNRKTLNLERVNINFDVSKFYRTTPSYKTQKDEIKINESGVIISKIQVIIEKDTLCYFNDEFDNFSGDIYISKINGWMGTKSVWMDKNTKPIEIFGHQYTTVGWSPRDTVVELNNLYFYKIDMIEKKMMISVI